MAQRALGAGTVVPLKRAMFGLLDSDGWAWASVKSFLWLIFIIFILGYLPDRAYYLTVSSTVDLGVLVWSPINLCPPTNETLPCPAPAGAVIPWNPSPTELALPAARTDGSVLQVGTQILYIGGTDGKTAQSSVYVAQTVQTGNFDKWQQGPTLPDARADASVVYVAGSIYVIGGIDGSGKTTDTVFVLSPDSQTGQLGAWTKADDLKLPEGRAGGATAITTDGLIIVGGRNDSGPVATTWRTRLNSGGKLGAWTAEQPLVQPQNDAIAAVVGDYIWVYGGNDANGPVGAVQRGAFGAAAAAGLPPDPNTGKVIRWDINNAANLPVARTNASGWSANGTLYLVGGDDGSGPQPQLYWAIPSTNGDLPEWKHLDATDLPAGLEGAPAVISGPNVILVGGETTGGTILASSVRANTAPLPPFFQLGLVGATVPGLKIEGEIGQQLGYLNAALVGTIDFVLLILIGWAFAHKAKTREITERILRRGRRH
jgi:N-acetylneuraminic acid mutarotase